MWTLPITVKRNGEKFRRKVADLEMEVQKRDRQIAVLQAEVESLSAVVARDRLRVRAETARFAQQKAESENGRPESRV